MQAGGGDALVVSLGSRVLGLEALAPGSLSLCEILHCGIHNAFTGRARDTWSTMWRITRNLRSNALRWQISSRTSSAAISQAVSVSNQVTVLLEIKKAIEGSPGSPEHEAPAKTPSRIPASWASKEAKGSYKSSVDPAETARFAAVAETWWDYQGPYKPLHAINPVRLSFIRTALCRHFGKDPMTARPLEGLRILDVGCGGGLACEPLARMGAHVMGIDAVEKNIRVAAAHAEKDPTTSSIEYRYTTAEQLAEEKETFDVVLALEIIEHVADPKEFCKSLASLAKNDGIVVISTINRSITAYGLAIVAAEYVLGWVPRGTHDWFKFVTPEELALVMNEASFPMEESAGMVYNPITRRWFLSDDTNVNYIAYGINRSR